MMKANSQFSTAFDRRSSQVVPNSARTYGQGQPRGSKRGIFGRTPVVEQPQNKNYFVSRNQRDTTIKGQIYEK
jgi:hypothetical protein